MTRPYSVAEDALDVASAILKEEGDTPSAGPIRLIALALSNSKSAKEQFPNFRLTRLVGARLELDERDVTQLADLIGDQTSRPIASVSRSFNDHLRYTIARYNFEDLFSADGHAPYHHAVRPTGYDFYRGEVIPSGMERWRANFRNMSDERQMLAASIIWLYRAGKDNVWLRRVPCTWHAADAIACMNEKRVFLDWARLFALYPGW